MDFCAKRKIGGRFGSSGKESCKHQGGVGGVVAPLPQKTRTCRTSNWHPLDENPPVLPLFLHCCTEGPTVCSDTESHFLFIYVFFVDNVLLLIMFTYRCLCVKYTVHRGSVYGSHQ